MSTWVHQGTHSSRGEERRRGREEGKNGGIWCVGAPISRQVHTAERREERRGGRERGREERTEGEEGVSSLKGRD